MNLNLGLFALQINPTNDDNDKQRAKKENKLKLIPIVLCNKTKIKCRLYHTS